MSLICIVEDDPDILEIESCMLREEGHQILGFNDAGSFLKQLSQIYPDLIVLDVMLPDGSGYEILQKLKSHPSTRELPVVVVSALTGEMDAVKAFSNGADDYIRKPFAMKEFLTRINRFLRNKEDEICVMDGLVLNRIGRQASIDGKQIRLTATEFNLLSYLMRNQGIVLPREQILQKVWGYDFIGTSRTLDMHIASLRKKLKDYAKRIKTVRNVGYIIA